MRLIERVCYRSLAENIKISIPFIVYNVEHVCIWQERDWYFFVILGFERRGKAGSQGKGESGYDRVAASSFSTTSHLLFICSNTQAAAL